MVHPVDDWLGRSEVRGEMHDIVGEGLARGKEQPDVGPSKAVDRLFRISDHEQMPRLRGQIFPFLIHPRRVGSDKARQLQLDWVGVLELIEQQPLPTRVQVAAHDVAVLGMA